MVDPTQPDLERERLDLERYKARLDYRKFVLGSVFAAVAIAAIPPLFQLATAVLEYVKSQSQIYAEQEKFHETYIKEFLDRALSQEIEVRMKVPASCPISSVSTPRAAQLIPR
jgi:hypothetical protein